MSLAIYEVTMSDDNVPVLTRQEIAQSEDEAISMTAAYWNETPQMRGTGQDHDAGYFDFSCVMIQEL